MRSWLAKRLKTLPSRIAEWPTGSGAEINIERDKNQDDDKNGEHDLAFAGHGVS